jgi:hypothetical protein
MIGILNLCFSSIPPIHAILKEHPEVQSRPNLLSSVHARDKYLRSFAGKENEILLKIESPISE